VPPRGAQTKFAVTGEQESGVVGLAWVVVGGLKSKTYA